MGAALACGPGATFVAPQDATRDLERVRSVRPCFVFACFCGWRCLRARLTQPYMSSTALSAFTACQALDVLGHWLPSIQLFLEDVLGFSTCRLYASALVLLLSRPLGGWAQLLDGHLDSYQVT